MLPVLETILSEFGRRGPERGGLISSADSRPQELLQEVRSSGGQECFPWKKNLLISLPPDLLRRSLAVAVVNLDLSGCP